MIEVILSPNGFRFQISARKRRAHEELSEIKIMKYGRLVDGFRLNRNRTLQNRCIPAKISSTDGPEAITSSSSKIRDIRSPRSSMMGKSLAFYNHKIPQGRQCLCMRSIVSYKTSTPQ